jgi:hypothetical protein
MRSKVSYRNISIFTSISYHSLFTWPPFLFFQHDLQYDTCTLLPTPCVHKLKAGIAYYHETGPRAAEGIIIYVKFKIN